MPHPQAFLPKVEASDTFDDLCRKLARYISKTIRRPVTFESLSTSSQGKSLRPLCRYLSTRVYHPSIIPALMALVGFYNDREDDDLPGTNAGRATACEFIALRCASQMSDRELIDCLLVDVKDSTAVDNDTSHVESQPIASEHSPLLGYGNGLSPLSRNLEVANDETDDISPSTPVADRAQLVDIVAGLNGLEIASVSNAKKFLGDKSIQRIVTAIWDGDIVFWSDLSPGATKHAHLYRARDSDPYARLRVPKYLKAFEVVFFVVFLLLYYMVLIQKPYFHVTAPEVLLYLWLASFAYNELGELWDAGTAFYLSDFWTLWDVAIVVTGFAFLICRIVGLSRGDRDTIDVAFDILALEALFLVPRICSLLSLHPYFGTLLPCLRDMSKDFVKFLSLVVILYLGFLTTFSLLARGQFTFRQMSWILIQVFFGSSYLGFDVAGKISPILGPPLMFIFVCMTNILLITSLISILSNSLAKILEHASDEYKFVYSVFVLEASTSNRLTYFLPPLNLIPLVMRPIRLVLGAEQLRSVRIVLLKFTHAPHIVAIQAYERVRRRMKGPQIGALPTTTGMTPERVSKSNKRFSRGSKLLSAPQPFTAANLRTESTDGFDDESSSDAQEAHRLGEALDAIRGLEATVARLTRQVEVLSA